MLYLAWDREINISLFFCDVFVWKWGPRPRTSSRCYHGNKSAAPFKRSIFVHPPWVPNCMQNLKGGWKFSFAKMFDSYRLVLKWSNHLIPPLRGISGVSAKIFHESKFYDYYKQNRFSQKKNNKKRRRNKWRQLNCSQSLCWRLFELASPTSGVFSSAGKLFAVYSEFSELWPASVSMFAWKETTQSKYINK